MSKTKFLGIPAGGKRAGWMEMEGGGSADVGGGVQVVTLTGDDSGGSMVYTSSQTGAQIAAMARTGPVIANIVTPDGGTNIAVYAGSYMGSSSFIATVIAGSKVAVNAFCVSENDTTVTGGMLS